MRLKKINLVILLGILCLLSILLIQVNWIKKSIAIQQTNIEIHEKKDSLFLKQFTEKSHIALSNVLEEITKYQKEPTQTYGAIKQVQTNYYTVDINEELQPYYLEFLLKKNFYEEQIFQNFQYSIYDCFSDSIVYGRAIKYTKDSLYSYSANNKSLNQKPLEWKKDGHYFTVYFPDVTERTLLNPTEKYTPWLFVLPIAFIVILFFGYTLSVINKQKRLDTIKNDFINNMTHELKTPISTISLSSEMLLNSDLTNDPEKLKRYAGIIYKENKRLEDQVNSVLNVAKLEKEKLVLNITEFDIHELIEDAKETFTYNQLEQTGNIELKLDAKKSIIKGDIVHITNVIYNLLDNAIKYSKENPTIEVETKIIGNKFLLKVKDNGIGISSENVKNIFDKFYRVPTGNLHNVKGFGLGLYYVKLIIEEHKGTIEVVSSINKGTTFSINLPI